MSPRPISCEEVLARLFAYLDGELRDVEQAEIDRHLEWCRDCFTRAEFERRLKARLAQAGRASPPERLRERLKLMMARF
ncbi:MAG: anti-sigma factor [Alphaproteobacteria bacterium]|nr:anti-sigma factor [Alphaproteobacteria bacterium]